jgi:hypothetical protein
MSTEDERREYSRFTIPVIIDAQGISDIFLVPEDVSAGGFRVVVSKKPIIGESIPCTIQVLGENFQDCRGRVIWSTEISGAPGTWSIGFRVDSAGEETDLLNGKLKELSVFLRQS